MIIEYDEEDQTLDQVLLYAQAISEAFAKALDQKECNVKLLIGFAEEIENAVTDLTDIGNITDPKNPDNPYVVDKSNPDVSDIVESKPPTSTPPLNTQKVIDKLKESCLDCEFGFPSIDFNANLGHSFDKLRALLDLYTNLFKKSLNPNFCHLANVFSYACIPSILSLIMLLVAAYSAILALKQLGGISLNAFIKGIITGLLGTIIANLSLRIDTSKTGVGCLIQTIRELADEVRNQSQAVASVTPEEILEKIGYKNEQSLKEDSSVVKETTDWTDAYANLTLEKRSLANRFLDRVEKENKDVGDAISKIFLEVGGVLEDMVGNFNENMQNMFGLLDFFQCESERSGSDFSSILEYMDKLANVINLLSAILTIVAKKQIEKLCKTGQSVSEMTTVLEKDVLGEPLTDLEQVTVIGEFLEKVVEYTEDSNGDISPIIYDKGKEPLLRKLKITTCNLTDFIKDHELGNVVDKVLEDINKDNNTGSTGNMERPNTSKPVIPGGGFVVDKGRWELYPLQFEKPKTDITRADNNSGGVVDKVVDGINNSDFDINSGIKDLLDIIYNNPFDIKTENSRKDTFKATPPTVEEVLVNTDYREFIKTPLSVDKSKKKAFDNKCKSIEDVFEILESIKR